ncbi:hypothetical protein SDC9_59455 [bioreactor metagenome]|uniref:DUF4185 domain-containing protein n=1 Tax=bioreactor metagenome TaxID=1076179 RepID=A0A644XA91_9ZZZZ
MTIYRRGRYLLNILLVISFLASCAPRMAVPAPTTTSTATTMPMITATPIPDLSIDLLPFIHMDNVTYNGNTIVMNNMESTNWLGTGAGPFPIATPFDLKIEYSMEGDFGGITLYGNIGTPDSSSLPRIVIGPMGKIGFINDQTGTTQEYDIPVENGKAFFLNFLDPQGKQIEVLTETGQAVKQFDVTKDLNGIDLPDGLFPNKEFFFDIQTAPKSKLEISQLSMQVSPDGVYAAAIDTKCSLTVGDQEIILTNEQLRAAGLRNWPDTILGVWRDGDIYHFIGASPQDSGFLRYSALANGTLDNPISVSVEPTIPIQKVKDTYGYIGGGPVYRDTKTGTLLMIYDTEKYPPDSGVHSNNTPVHNVDGMAKSTDNGKTWTDLGIILDTEFPGWADWNIGVGNAPFVINGDYFYVYITDVLIANPRFDIGTTVARAKVADVLDAAINHDTVVPWFKYYQGQWSQPGIGGKSSPIEIGNPQSTDFSVSYNEYLGRYIKINPSILGDFTHLYLSESVDGIHWTLRVPIDESPGDKVFPTIIGLGSDPSITDKDFYVYYLFTPNWAEADAHGHTVLARRKISCGPDN